MSASIRHFVAPAHQRGAIAIMTAFLMTALCVLALTEFAIAALTIEKRKTQNAVDAVALELADEMIIKPNSQWTQMSLAVSYLLSNNGQGPAEGVAPPTISTPTINYGFGPYSASAAEGVRDAWIPASVQVRATATPTTPMQKIVKDLAGLLPSGNGGSYNTQYSVDANARVAQVQLASFTVSRARAMVLFDYSPSMRLSYKGYEGNWTYSGIWTEMYAMLEMVGGMYQQYNFSVRTFGYKSITQAKALVYKSTDIANNPTFEQATDYMLTFPRLMYDQNSIGDAQNNGTDMITPIQDAMTELRSNNDPLAGAPILILVSDGEPDMTPNTPCTGKLADCVAAAAKATQDYMNTVFTTPMSGDGFVGANVESFTYLINRDNANLASEDVSFMKGMAGDQNHMPAGNANNYELDQLAQNASYMASFVETLPIKDYCMSQDISAFTSGSKKPDDMAYPQPGEPIQGYFTLGNYSGGSLAHQDTYQVRQVMSFSEFFAPIPAYPRIDKVNPLLPDGTLGPLNEVLSDPSNKLATFYYDTMSHTVWLNPWLCFNLTYYQKDPTTSPPRFRMRWGRPVMTTSSQDPLTAY